MFGARSATILLLAVALAAFTFGCSDEGGTGGTAGDGGTGGIGGDGGAGGIGGEIAANFETSLHKSREGKDFWYRVENNGMEMWRYEGDNPNMYQVEHDELFAAIRSGRHINEGVSMAHSTLLGIMGRMCAYTGATLSWDQCLNSEENLTPNSWEWGDAPFPAVAMPGVTRFV